MRRQLLALGLAAACLAPSSAFAQDAQGDPWEGLNRDLFALHEAVDRALLGPIARGYRAITPEPFREGVRNVLRNLRSPVVFANDLLQGEGERAGVTAARFGVNTTIGIAGIFDPAASMGLEHHDEDFGQTLAVWGADAGAYIFVPVLGPTTVRDATGRIVDLAFDPLTWAESDNIDTARAARTGMAALSAREGAIEAVESARRDAIDPYVSIRTSYGLVRESAIRNGRADVQDLPEFEEILEEPTPTLPPDAPPAPDEIEPANEVAPGKIGATP
jgi:phospholipid-binding lipoprotein MlaA